MANINTGGMPVKKSNNSLSAYQGSNNKKVLYYALAGIVGVMVIAIIVLVIVGLSNKTQVDDVLQDEVDDGGAGGTTGDECSISSDCSTGYVCVSSRCILGDGGGDGGGDGDGGGGGSRLLGFITGFITGRVTGDEAGTVAYYNDGYVGIGTNDPGNPLHVLDDGRHSIAYFQYTGGGVGRIGIGDTSDIAYFGTFGKKAFMGMSPDTTKNLVVDINGGVGIGSGVLQLGDDNSFIPNHAGISTSANNMGFTIESGNDGGGGAIGLYGSEFAGGSPGVGYRGRVTIAAAEVDTPIGREGSIIFRTHNTAERMTIKPDRIELIADATNSRKIMFVGLSENSGDSYLCISAANIVYKSVNPCGT